MNAIEAAVRARNLLRYRLVMVVRVDRMNWLLGPEDSKSRGVGKRLSIPRAKNQNLGNPLISRSNHGKKLREIGEYRLPCPNYPPIPTVYGMLIRAK